MGNEPVKYDVLLDAKQGDTAAMEQILKYYENYINACCRRRFFDEYGNEYYGIDTEMRDRIKIKLITNIICDFDLTRLPAGEILEN